MPDSSVLQTPGARCFVPGCHETRTTEDCCDDHGKNHFAPHARHAIPNDGVLDRVAIELAAQGARPVNLTWVERDIAAALMLYQGYTPDEMVSHMGHNLLKSKIRRERIYAMAEAMRKEGGLRLAD